ncbi:MAG: glycoside hydrolase family 3 N-terminal domain-containing protein [Vicingaceae bacterium]
MKIKRLLILLIPVSFFSFSVNEEREQPPFLEQKSVWADSIHAQMTLDEKIGQLFNVAANSTKGKDYEKEVESLIQEYHLGGLTFFKGGPVQQAKLTNRYQSLAKTPLMIAIDGEWGLSMRLDSTIKYPWQMTLGAIQDDELLYQMGLDVAEQFRRIGVHVNFAPVVDVNNNPENPVIFARSFGEDKRNVARKGIAYMKGMQDGNLLACAKHFPGHGDTDTDSHKSLPVVNFNRERIDSLELYPFRKLIDSGISSIMTAHLYLPQITGVDKRASSLTSEVVDTMLLQELEYKGLVFTDGLNMGGVAKYQESQDIDLQALIAGNDVLLLSQDIPKAFELIKAALADGRLDTAAINRSSLKVLRAKEWLGLDKMNPVKIEGLVMDLNQAKYKNLNRKLMEHSLTLLRNKKNILPIKELNDKRIVNVVLAEEGVSYRPFQKSLNNYARVDTLHYAELPVAKQKTLMDTLLTYDEIIVSIHKSNKNPWVSAELNTEFKNFINILRLKKKITLAVFANAYSLKEFLAADYVDALIMAYQNSIDAQELSAQLIFGGIKATGKLPVNINRNIEMGMGIESKTPIRFNYTMPEAVGLASSNFNSVDSIVLEGIAANAFPGAQVFIAKDGQVIYNKSFGRPTYTTNDTIKPTDLYDIASITKIASTLLAIMQLDSEDELSLDDKLGKHLKMVRGTDYEDIVLRDMLAHQAGLAAWIPFYVKTLHHGMPRYDIYSSDSSTTYSNRVAEKLYINKNYEDTIYSRIINRAKLDPKKEYKYSDIGYYFMKEVVEKITKESIEAYNQENFYGPIGMSRTTFKPRNKFDLSEIVPTEDDNIFRKQLIHGDVHDPGAAMLGGIGGHAGLFSTANDLGKLMQMYLNGGTYGGQRYLKEEVLTEYQKCQFCEGDIPQNKEENRRGAGFDKPAWHGEPGPTCDCVSYASFGHSGFTGTYAWADPDEQIVYVFLSNRIYPDATNGKLVSMNIRTRIQEVIYDAIAESNFRNSQSALIEPQSK